MKTEKTTEITIYSKGHNHNEPLKKAPKSITASWEIDNVEDFVERIEKGAKKTSFPIVVIAGRNVSGSLL